MSTATFFRNGDAGIAGHPGKFAPQHRPDATGTLAPASRELSQSIASRIDAAQTGMLQAKDLLEDGRESGRAHALAESYARMVFDEGDDFDYAAEGESMLDDRISGDTNAFNLPLELNGRKRDEVVGYLRGRAAEAFTKATSGEEIADVAAFHSGEYESFTDLADELDTDGDDF